MTYLPCTFLHSLNSLCMCMHNYFKLKNKQMKKNIQLVIKMEIIVFWALKLKC